MNNGKCPIRILLLLVIGAIFLSGCGGGGGGRGSAVPGASQTPVTPVLGKITGRFMIATANAGRMAPRAADAFLSKIPANTPQSLEVPEAGYAPLADAQVNIDVNGTVKNTTTDSVGNWVMTEVPAGTQVVVATKNGKNVTVPITVAGNEDNVQLTLVTEDNSGNLQAEGQLIHGDGTDGYKKETHIDSTSDTVFEDGTRDHHSSNGNTDRDVTDDGIVDQRFPDPNDDGVPDGPVLAQGGEAPAVETPSTLVDNSPPEIQSITSKDNKGKKTDIVETGGSLGLELNVHDTDGGALNVKWKVEDAEGNDVTSLFLNSSDIIAPTFSPPQGEYNKPGAYIVIATTTDANGASSEKDIILTVDTPGNKAPHASIKANHTAGDAPLTVDFTCDAFDTDGSIVSYCWDFDKSNGINQNDCDDTRISVTKTFISEGKYRVTCIVTDDKGATAFAKRVVVVRKKNSPPVITKFTADKTTAVPGEKIRIAVAVTDPDGDIVDTAIITTGGTMTDTNISDGFVDWVAPQVPGEYVVQITATDPSGEEDAEFVKIKVETPANKPPTVKATATPSTGTAPFNVTLTAVATDPDGTIASVTWDYDDSDGIQIDASGNTATVKYGGPGDYIATVIACDNAGACATDKVKITVTQPNRPPFISHCSAAAASAIIGDTIALFTQAMDEDNNDLTYNWSVNGGSLSSSTDLMPMWTVPPTPGDYTATVSVTDGQSAPVTCTTTLTVNPEKLEKQPDPPKSCNVTGGNASAVLQWEPSPSENIDHYKLLRSLNGGGFSEINSNISKTALQLEDSGLANGNTYNYQLMAVDAKGFISAACEDGMQVVPQTEVEEVIPVGNNPSDVEYDPVTDKIYVPNAASDTVSVIDGVTNQVIKTITVGDQPVDVCGDTVQGLMYVTNKGENTVSVINENSGTVTKTIPVGHAPASCVVNELTKEVFVGNKDDNTVTVIDGTTGTVKATISVGTQPRVCDANENLNILYVTDRVNDKLDLIDMTTHQLLHSAATGNAPEGCVSNDTTGEVYVPNKEDGTVTVHKGDTGEIKDTISVGGNPECTCSVNTISNQIYITNTTLNQVHLINGATKKIDGTVNTGTHPQGTCSMSSENKVCVANGGGDSVTVINNPLPPFVVDPYPPSNPTHCFATATAGRVALDWTACNDDDLQGYKILRGLSGSGPFTEIAPLIMDTQYIDTTVLNGTQYYYQVKAHDRNGNDSDACFDNASPEEEVVNVVETGGTGPCCMDTVENKIFIANEETNTIDVINRDTFQHITTINVTDCCGDMVADHVHNLIYVTNKTTNKITVINGTNYIIEKVIDIPGTGQCSYNDITNNIYVTNDETSELIIHNPDTEETHTVYVGGCPCDVNVDHVTNKIYVTSKLTKKLTIINGTNNIVEDVIDVGAPVTGCTVNDVTNQVYMTSESTNEVIVYNTKTKRVTNHIQVGEGPTCSPCGVNTESNQVYVTNKDSGTISLIDGATNTLVDTISVGHDPIGTYVDPVTNKLYVLNYGGDNISVINNPLPAVQTDTTAPAQPSGLTAISGDTGVALSWNANAESDLSYYNIYRKTNPAGDFGAPLTATINNSYNDISVATGTVYYYAASAVDTSNNESLLSATVNGRKDLPTLITVGAYPGNIAVNETLNRVFVSNRDSNNVTIIDANTHAVLGTMAAGIMPWGLGVDIATGRVYVANIAGLGVSVLNGATGAVIGVGNTNVTGPSGVAVDNINSRYYVSHSNMTGTVVVMNSTTDAKIISISTVPGSAGIAVNRTTRMIYVANGLNSSVSVINGATNAVVGIPIVVGSQPTDVVVDETSNKVYVSCAGVGKVYVINGATNTVASNITVGLEPMGLGFDATRHLVYVANAASGTVSVINGATDTVAGTINVGGDPSDVGVHSALNKIFISLKTAGKVIAREGF